MKRAPQRYRSAQLNLRVTAEELARLDAATSLLVPGVRVPMGPWILAQALAAADEVISKRGRK